MKVIQGSANIKIRQEGDQNMIKITVRNAQGDPAAEIHIAQTDFVVSLFGNGNRPCELILLSQQISQF